MARPGTDATPLRVAIIGAGPTGFYAAEHLFRHSDLSVEVDLFDRLPTPYGLVRGGVAPDHQKIKNVTRVFDRVADHERFRFFGNVEYGVHVHLDELKQYYHQIFFATGAQTDRNLGIPGEDLAGSHSATEFVAWYNGHPDYRHCSFDLSARRVAVVGVGNVAVDVARILCRSNAELAATDIADYALEALQSAGIEEVIMLGRRGPAQAAFTNPEIKELGELEDADVYVPMDEAQLDPLSREALDAEGDRMTSKKVEIIQSYASRPLSGRPKRLVIRFLVSPTELVGDEKGHVRAMRIEKNELYRDDRGRIRPRPTGETEEIPVELVFRSVGYTGVELPGVPFDADWGVILNERGRILSSDARTPIPGLYAGGWIKRGATGVIGTNKPDAAETVDCMIEDLANGVVLEPTHPSAQAAEAFVASRQPCYFSYADWKKLDELETCSGEECGRPRVKFTRVDDMIEALGKIVPQA